MSSFIRTIQRAAKRKCYFNGRGSRLAVPSEAEDLEAIEPRGQA